MRRRFSPRSKTCTRLAWTSPTHDLGLVDEHLDKFLVAGEVGENAFDGDFFLKAMSAVELTSKNLGHSSNADALEQGVLAELFVEGRRLCSVAMPSLLARSRPKSITMDVQMIAQG